ALDIGLAPLDLPHHLLDRVPALRRVPGNLPLHAERRLRIEKDGETKRGAEVFGMERQETASDDEFVRNEWLIRIKRPVRVIVDGLDDRLAGTKRMKMPRHEIESIAVRR